MKHQMLHRTEKKLTVTKHLQDACCIYTKTENEPRHSFSVVTSVSSAQFLKCDSEGWILSRCRGSNFDQKLSTSGSESGVRITFSPALLNVFLHNTAWPSTQVILKHSPAKLANLNSPVRLVNEHLLRLQKSHRNFKCSQKPSWHRSDLSMIV